MQHFEHCHSLLEVPYQVNKSGLLIKTQNPPMQLNLEELKHNKDYKNHLEHYQNLGYELTSVQALFEAFEYSTKSQTIAGNSVYPLTKALILFWKRPMVQEL